MPYSYLDDIALADVAFIARGETLGELFRSASDALLNVMIEDIQSIESMFNKQINLRSDSTDMLLFQFLGELIYLKDAHQLLLRTSQIIINPHYTLVADVYGETINREKHQFIVDVKAVTLHLFYVKKIKQGWEAQVILDV